MGYAKIDWSDAPKFGRSKPLRYALELLHIRRELFDAPPLIVETGTTRGDLGGGLEGDGWATLAFGWYCKKYGGDVITIDIEEEAIKNCKIITYEYKDNIVYHVGDSASYLSSMGERTINLLYLDSADDPTIIMNELLAAESNLKTNSIILIDDTHENLTKGKGTEAGPFLLGQGWEKIIDSNGVVIFVNEEDPFEELKDIKDIYFEIQSAVEPTIKLDVKDYDDKAMLWHNLFFNELPAKHILPPNGVGVRSVLDLGCNTGYNTKMLADMYGHAVGIDINPKLIFASRVNHDKCVLGDVSNLETVLDESFSLVIAKDVLEHSDKPTEAIEEVYRVLIDRGRFLFLIPLDGQASGVDDVAIHPIFNYGNESHVWKATLSGALKRIYEAGFTNVAYKCINHKEVFGQDREFGNDFLIVWGEKRKDVVKLPVQWLTREAHWGAFVTLRCTANCHYCLQKFSEDEFRKCLKAREELDWKYWSVFYNLAQKQEIQPISVVGGEPTLYEGLIPLINSLDGYHITVTTNLHSPMFNNIEEFASSIIDKDMFRLNTSFHPKLMPVGEFARKVHEIRYHGVYVDQVAMVDHPGSEYRKHYLEFINHGLRLTPQTFLGKIGDTLFPNQYVEGITNEATEHQITNYDLYEEGFSYREKKPIQCSVQKFLVAPNGDAHRCHYHLYSGRDVLFNIIETAPNSFSDFTSCDDFGFCNPCDYPRSEFRSCEVGVGDLVNLAVDNKEVVSTTVQYIAAMASENEEFKEFITALIFKLYPSLDPWWTLYNDKELRKVINDFVGKGEFMDNRYARIIAEFEKSLFRVLPVNVYRILDEIPLFKYIEAASATLRGVIKEYFPEMRNTENDFGKALATCGTLPLYKNIVLFDPEGKIYISDEEE